jgi:hypothetical protein
MMIGSLEQDSFPKKEWPNGKPVEEPAKKANGATLLTCLPVLLENGYDHG